MKQPRHHELRRSAKACDGYRIDGCENPATNILRQRLGECRVEGGIRQRSDQREYAEAEQKRQLARRMNEACEQPVVTAIRVVVARP